MAKTLTKRKRNGILYSRPHPIEESIDEALNQDLDTLIGRAGVRAQSEPGYLPSECLVYLLREARSAEDQVTLSALLPLLLGRCEAILNTKLDGRYLSNVEDTREEILGEFSVLFAEDICDDKFRLDFFECRFNLAFRTFRLRWVNRIRAENEGRVFEAPEDESADIQTEDDFLSRLSAKNRGGANGLDPILKDELLKEIDALPLHQRNAVMLVYYNDLPIESEDPSKISAASLGGVTGRTIRNRISKALKTLSATFNK